MGINCGSLCGQVNYKLISYLYNLKLNGPNFYNCSRPASRFQVSLAEHSLLDDAEFYSTAEYRGPSNNACKMRVRQTIVHPSYNDAKKTEHDIALVQLQKRVEWNDRIQPACFSDHKMNIKNSYSGLMATVAGWGGGLTCRLMADVKRTFCRRWTYRFWPMTTVSAGIRRRIKLTSF